MGYEGETHFRLPDLRGRVAIGVHETESRVAYAKDPGIVGGQEAHVLTIAQLPHHEHDKIQLTLEHADEHTHAVHNPRHFHRMGDVTRPTSQAELVKSVSAGIVAMAGGHRSKPCTGVTGIQQNSGIR